MILNIKRSAFALSLLGAFGMAQASILAVNTPTTSVDYSATFFGGTLLANFTTPISNASYNGFARAAVYDTGTGLDFYYQYSNDISSDNGVDRFSASDFRSLGATAVNVYQTDAAFGIFLKGTERSDFADRSGFGVIGFTFVPNGNSKINPGTTSFTQIIRTNARSFKEGNFGLLDGIGDNAQGYAPAAAVPEPETYAMLLAGLGLMGAIARRRNKGQKGSETATS
ncbi:hypothetical protein AEP_03329 [Curvibacter sp. AEP1-3]|uniref:PEP-CTERM sorting domain-containing protein n=1 Tax=Curvibacter sp. AEP1-3 TaxID=1844971 RepID=UPI000B579C02|nr:PEP-CTERM sorting domain-containing protein [Curvibacter sp. AEP1-3]ARV20251.1 hypothetical protein AEP_03329 [Curvibacter sp. AEP1-3]